MKSIIFPIGFLCAAGLLMLSASCGDDPFTQIVDIELPEHESRLAVVNLMYSDEDEAAVLVSNSRSVLSNDPFSDYPDADVALTGGNLGSPSFSYNSEDGLHRAFLGEEWATAGETYQLSVQQARFPMVSATQLMPPLPVIEEASAEEEGAFSEDGERLDALEIEIIDPAGDQYYAIQASVEQEIIQPGGDTVLSSYSIWLESSDPILSQAFVRNQTALLCTDDAFDNRSYRFLVYTFDQLPFEDPNSRLIVRVTSLSRDAYLYLRSLEQYNQADGNPFAEPVTVHSNIEDGYGIFGLGNVARYVIEF
jgi:hypothetical protein